MNALTEGGHDGRANVMGGIAVSEAAAMAWRGSEAVGMIGCYLEAIDMTCHGSDAVGMA